MWYYDEALIIYHKSLENCVLGLVYVDNILMSSPSTLVLNQTVEGLKEDLTLTSSRILSQYLRMNLWKTKARAIRPSAEKYTENLQGIFSLNAEGKKVNTSLLLTEHAGIEPVSLL